MCYRSFEDGFESLDAPVEVGGVELEELVVFLDEREQLRLYRRVSKQVLR